jgi:hypothetical protein
LSFFDDDDPARRSGGTRTARPPRRPAPGGPPPRDDQQLLIRRLVAGGIGLLVIILLFVAVKGCLDSQAESALKDYNREVGSLTTQSDNEVGDKLFDLLSNAGEQGGGQDLQVQVNGLRGDQDRLLDEVEALDVPDEMSKAQQELVTVMELRRDALARIAADLPEATSDGPRAEAAVAKIAGQMQAFLASDVLYSQQVVPVVQNVLNENEIGGQRIAQSRFLDDPLSWLDKTVVAERVSGTASGSKAKKSDADAAPGLHGHSLDSVNVGDVTLSPDAANRIPASGDLSFTVTLTNAGENEESDVPVKLSITGAGRPINAETTVDSTQPGESATAEIPLNQTPPVGTPVTIKVTVDKVPGEDKTDNNSESFPAVFTR